MSEFLYPSDSGLMQQNSWRLFRIMAEFVNGFETFTGAGPFISVFGSARMKKTHRYYKLAYEVSTKIAQKGFSVITGSGPGLMEAVNKAAQEAGKASAGLVPDLPYEPTPNKYIDPQFCPRFRYFFVRKVMFVRYAQGFIFLPGGYGTMDELFEILTLVQTKRTLPVPIYLMGTDYWKGLVDWIRTTMINEHTLCKKESHLFTLTDDPDEVANGLLDGYHSRMTIQQEVIETI